MISLILETFEWRLLACLPNGATVDIGGLTGSNRLGLRYEGMNDALCFRRPTLDTPLSTHSTCQWSRKGISADGVERDYVYNGIRLHLRPRIEI